METATIAVESYVVWLRYSARLLRCMTHDSKDDASLRY